MIHIEYTYFVSEHEIYSHKV